MSEMTNEQKFKTAEERVKAFTEWCRRKKSCDKCEFGKHKRDCAGGGCQFYWLAIEASGKETVAEVCAELKELANGANVNNEGIVVEISQDEIWDACDRIEASHVREVAELRECLKEAIVKYCNFEEGECCFLGTDGKCKNMCSQCKCVKWRKVLEATKGANDEVSAE